MKVSLSPEQETLLIPLYAKGQPDNPIFYDPAAGNLLKRIDYDFSKLKVPYKTIVLICQRVKKFDSVTGSFLSANPNGLVLHLGCGLDNRFWRVDNGQVTWVDLDMPPVIDLRRQLFPEDDRCHLIASSVTEFEWIEQVPYINRPTLILAEGLLMYLNETDVRELVLRLKEVFPGSQLTSDVFSRMTARAASRHPSLKRTGATIGFGIDDAREIEGWAPGIRLLEEWFFSQDPDLRKLSPGYRLAYKLAGASKTVRMAHQVVSYQL